MILVIDNYDSFTYNLVHYLEELGAPAPSCVATMRIERRRAPWRMEPSRPSCSRPGRARPDEAGVCLALLASAAPKVAADPWAYAWATRPSARPSGARWCAAKALMHGKTSPVRNTMARGSFTGLCRTASPRRATTAWRCGATPCLHTLGDHRLDRRRRNHGPAPCRTRPIHGVQFHPESIATQGGHRLLANFLRLAGVDTRVAA